MVAREPSRVDTTRVGQGDSLLAPTRTGVPKNLLIFGVKLGALHSRKLHVFAFYLAPVRILWWRGRDSNPRRRMPTDLQSAPFDRFGTSPSSAKAGDLGNITIALVSSYASSAVEINRFQLGKSELSDSGIGRTHS